MVTDMKKILITGSLGLVGSEAMKFFANKGWEVVGIDNNMRSRLFGTPSKSGAFDIDIRDTDQVMELFNRYAFDAIIHAAAQPSHDYSKDHVREDFEVNTVGTLNLLEATKKFCPEAVFVHVSTDKVYGANMERVNLEERPTRYHSTYPFSEYTNIDQSIHSPFGVSKLAADLYVQEYGYQYGMKTACFRCGCITGKNHEGAEQHGFLAYLAKCIKEGIPYTVHGFKGKQVRDQIHAYDLVNAFWHFIENPQIAQVYNMGGGPERSMSVLEAIDLIEEETGKKAQVSFSDKPRFADRIWDVHDISRFKEDYPTWLYKYSLNDIIKDICSK